MAHQFQLVATLAHIPAGRDGFVDGDRVDGIPLPSLWSSRMPRLSLYPPRYSAKGSAVMIFGAISLLPAIPTTDQSHDNRG